MIHIRNKVLAIVGWSWTILQKSLFPLIFVSVILSIINCIFSASKSRMRLQFGKKVLSLGVTSVPQLDSNQFSHIY